MPSQIFKRVIDKFHIEILTLAILCLATINFYSTHIVEPHPIQRFDGETHTTADVKHFTDALFG